MAGVVLGPRPTRATEGMIDLPAAAPQLPIYAFRMTSAHIRVRVSLIVALAFASLLGGGQVWADASGGGQRGGQGGQAGPLVIDFVAVGTDGKPVTDLKPNEVQVRVAGRNRTVTALDFVSAVGSGGASSAPAPYATNTGAATGRRFLVVIEDESMQPGVERPIREAVEAFLGALSPADQVGLSTAPRDTAGVPLGGDLAKVRQALGQVSGRVSAGADAEERACRARDTLNHLRNIVNTLAGSDAPSHVIFFSSGMSIPSRTNTGGYVCELTNEQFQAVGTAAATARAHLFVVQSELSVSQRNEGLETLAGLTGAGAVMRLAGNEKLDRVLTESSGYYKLTLEPDNNDRLGQSARLEVRVSRSGVSARSHEEVVPVRGAAAAGAATSPRDMLRTTVAFRDLPLRATAFASRGGKDQMMVMALAEPMDPGVKLTAVSAALVSPDSKIAFQSTADEKQLAQPTIAIPMAVAPGTYRLRVAATDSTGKSGAVDYQVDATLKDAGPLKLGSLVLLKMREGAAGSPALQFTAGDKLAGYLEMYGQLTGQISAKMEVAASADGPAIVSADPGGRGTSEPDRFILTAEIPMDKLTPGDYVVRAIVKMEGQPEGRVFRPLRIVAK